MSLKQEIIEFCSKIGIDTVGFSKCRILEESRAFFTERKSKGLENEFEEEDIEKRINPFLYMKEGKTIISIAFPYLYDKDLSGNIYFSKYTQGRDYHKVVEAYLKRISEFINTLGGKAICFVDSNSLPERYLAYQSGIGFIGKNGMLITKKYGSFVFLGEIITNLCIEEDKILDQNCGDCTICLEECPTKAINKKNACPNICLSYITQKKHIEERWFNKLNGRMFGCDSCQRKCPYNKNIKLSTIKEFKPLEHMKDINLNELINIDNKVFKEKYQLTSCGWRGKNILQRNALINNYMINKELGIRANEIKSPYIKEYYDKLVSLDDKE